MFLCSATGRLYYKQNQNNRNNIYCNHDDTFMDIPQTLRDGLVECQKTEPCRASKEALGYHVVTVIGRKYKHY